MLNFYRRFLPNPATTLLYTNYWNIQKRMWGCKSSALKRPILTLRNAKTFLSAATLNLQAPNQELCLVLDATDAAICAVMNMLTLKDFKQFVSILSKISLTEYKYSMYDRKLLAMYWKVKHMRHKPEGHAFTIFAQHRTLAFSFFKNSDSGILIG